MELRIKVGASRDRSLDTAFQPAVKAAQAAANTIANVSAAQARAVATNAKRGADAAEKEFGKLAKQAERWQKQMVRDAEKSIADKVRAEERGAAARARILERAARDEARVNDRAAREQQRTSERAAASAARSVRREQATQARALASGGKQNTSQNWGVARAVAGGAGSAARGGGRAAIGLARDIAEGSGVDFSAASIFSKNASLEEGATTLSNQGYMEHDPRNNVRVDPNALMKQALTTGRETGVDANEALEGLAKFTAKTGDLATGRDVLKDMSILAKVTGSSLDDTVDAAGDIANALGDVDNKSDRVKNLMTVIAAQGKMGAVEMKNLASQMAKVGAASGTFAGGDKSILQSAALVQMARARGGAASATQAASGMMAFSDVFSKGARLDKFQHFGVQVHEANGQVRDQKSLIVDMIRAASSAQFGGMGNFDRNMGAMVGSTQARRITRGAERAFTDAGGGEAGLAAAKDAIEKFEAATISSAEVQESFARAMQTSKSQAEVFNSKLREVGLETQKQLLPALIALGPAFLDLAKTFSSGAVMIAKVLGLPTSNGVDTQLKGDVNDALVSTDKQLAGGQISQATIDNNEAKTKATTAALAAAKKEAADFKPMGAASKNLLGGFDYTLPGLLMGAIGGGTGSEGFGHSMIKTNENEGIDKRDRVDTLEKQLTALNKVNDQILLRLNNGLEITKMPAQAGGPPGIDPDGRTPNSDQ